MTTERNYVKDVTSLINYIASPESVQHLFRKGSKMKFPIRRTAVLSSEKIGRECKTHTVTRSWVEGDYGYAEIITPDGDVQIIKHLVPEKIPERDYTGTGL